MSSYTDVKNLIISNIKANGQREITGPILQDVLLNMLENSSEADAANKEYVDNKINDIPVEKGSGYQSMVQKAEGNTADGQYSSAFGLETSASGNSANAEGWQTKSNGVASHAEGVQTEANGNASHAEGQKTITLNKAEHAEGIWNLSIKGKTIHTVGIGSSESSRKNAHEIHLDGKHYIYGIGGYDGTNSQTEGIKTVQEVAEEVQNKLGNCVDLNSEQTITAAKTFSGGINMNNTRIHKVKIPAMYDDAANKQYVDGTVSLANNAVQTTWSELKSLRDAGKLVPGTQYRITDYTCTTTQSGTKSAGHVFDIIVTADDESTLNEVARAVKHDGDTYFANSDLSAWKIWYCLDNDADRFAWADTTNGKGVIYRMIDEWNNDVPYDFKNIQFKHPKNTTAYPYYYYTFASDNAESNTDYSLSITNNCYSNTIREYVDRTKRELNYIIFIGSNCHSNTFGSGCYNNTFGSGCNNNTFGSGCYNNSFGYNGYNNIFGSGCYFNSFGYNGYNNIFGSGCYFNSFGYNGYNNIFGSDCNNNTFGYNGYNNIFGSGCYFNSFGNNYFYNSFGTDCYSNTFGEDCSNNSLGSYCFSNTLGKDSRRNTFGSGCYFNSFGNSCTNNSLGNGCYNITLKTSCDYNSFGNGCSDIIFGDRCHNNSFGNRCHNNSFGNSYYSNTLGRGCYNITFGNDCGGNSLGEGCYNNSFGDNCQNNSFGNNCYANSTGNFFFDNAIGNSCYNNIFGEGCISNTLGNGCTYIVFAETISATLKYHFYQNNHFGNGCRYILFKGTGTAGWNEQVQNYNFAQGLQGTSSAYLTIDGVRNRAYETKVAKNSNGDLKIYCEADLIL